ncbi:MAG: HAD-IA family hydrolase [Trichodesmium sp. St16_bin4-tuft]|nr:HAD-IA family hydrolase [Trichodesmium sp. MAG_R01]MDE5069517.1 HAD-IA family hydrolase [Trichodesmium sp. St4_bin8_1]MDE5072527.1 HAD-IA family hydrolase [Trichodesmium sp. St5_bin8]MDE5092629.1 HAD-IA family hydrolase [Trichodesmium sp. St18_bin3_1_1]MDE5101121.1 HAD-IA family hydrolase [Trichodesmium sp. St16_bin4-tuft]MDE5104477.1 HAD-IA family hydrolase [Trichodesmium sp. St19_bin2]
MNDFPKITHIIYDLDGLLLDTESIHAQVNQEVTSRYGKTFDKHIKCKITGRKSIDSARKIVELLELPITPENYLQQRNLLTYKRFPQAKPMPGAISLTQHLSQNKIPQAVATSSYREPFNLKTKNHQEWFQLFDYIVVGDDPNIQHGKPAPDIFLIAAQKLEVSPEKCLVFEDSLAGMEAALAARMSVVVVPDPDMDKNLFHSAHQIINSLTEFQPHLWQLPSFLST